MAIQISSKMKTSFSSIFSQWNQHPSPFYRKKEGVVQQAWLRLNLITRHIDIVHTAPVVASQPRFLPQSALLVIPMPKFLTGLQMDRILNGNEGLMERRESQTLNICRYESQDFARENVHEVLRYAFEQNVITQPKGRVILQDEVRVMGLLKNVQLWFEDLASLNEVAIADELPLSKIGLSGADDEGWQRKSMAHVTQLALKDSVRRLVAKEDVEELIHQIQQKPGVIYLGLRERVIRLARMTRETMDRLGDHSVDLQVATRPGWQATTINERQPTAGVEASVSHAVGDTIPADSKCQISLHSKEHSQEPSNQPIQARAILANARATATPKDESTCALVQFRPTLRQAERSSISTAFRGDASRQPRDRLVDVRPLAGSGLFGWRYCSLQGTPPRSDFTFPVQTISNISALNEYWISEQLSKPSIYSLIDGRHCVMSMPRSITGLISSRPRCGAISIQGFYKKCIRSRDACRASERKVVNDYFSSRHDISHRHHCSLDRGGGMRICHKSDLLKKS